MNSADKIRINRTEMFRLVKEKTKLSLEDYHIDSILSLLLDEIIQELQNGISHTLGNFGTFLTKQMGSRQHRNVVTGEQVVSSGYKTLRFTLDPKLHRFLLDRLDVDKTFGPDYHASSTSSSDYSTENH